MIFRPRLVISFHVLVCKDLRAMVLRIFSSAFALQTTLTLCAKPLLTETQPGWYFLVMWSLCWNMSTSWLWLWLFPPAPTVIAFTSQALHSQSLPLILISLPSAFAFIYFPFCLSFNFSYNPTKVYNKI